MRAASSLPAAPPFQHDVVDAGSSSGAAIYVGIADVSGLSKMSALLPLPSFLCAMPPTRFEAAGDTVARILDRATLAGKLSSKLRTWLSIPFPIPFLLWTVLL